MSPVTGLPLSFSFAPGALKTKAMGCCPCSKCMFFLLEGASRGSARYVSSWPGSVSSPLGTKADSQRRARSCRLDQELASRRRPSAFCMALNSIGDHHGSACNAVHREPCNKDKLVGQKAPFKLKDICALRVRLQTEGRVRELALFNLGITASCADATWSASASGMCATATRLHARAIVVQHKTQRPVQFEITPAARDAVEA